MRLACKSPEPADKKLGLVSASAKKLRQRQLAKTIDHGPAESKELSGAPAAKPKGTFRCDGVSLIQLERIMLQVICAAALLLNRSVELLLPLARRYVVRNAHLQMCCTVGIFFVRIAGHLTMQASLEWDERELSHERDVRPRR